MTHDLTVALAALGVAGQALAVLLALAAVAWRLGAPGPVRLLRSRLWGYELWLAFVVAAVATGGSLFFSETAGFVPCELCWFQRVCMYPLAGVTLFAAIQNDHRSARNLLPLPIVGAGLASYHLLLENGVVAQSRSCLLSAPGGCATKWNDLQCPFCRRFEAEAMPALLARYVRSGIARVELQILAFIGPDSERGRRAAIAAGQQDRMFDFAKLLLLNQGTENDGWLSEEMIARAAASIPGLNVPQLPAAREREFVRSQAARVDALAQADRVTGTPTILVGKRGAVPTPVQLSSPADAQSVAAAIERAAGRRG